MNRTDAERQIDVHQLLLVWVQTGADERPHLGEDPRAGDDDPAQQRHLDVDHEGLHHAHARSESCFGAALGHSPFPREVDVDRIHDQLDIRSPTYRSSSRTPASGVSPASWSSSGSRHPPSRLRGLSSTSHASPRSGPRRTRGPAISTGSVMILSIGLPIPIQVWPVEVPIESRMNPITRHRARALDGPPHAPAQLFEVVPEGHAGVPGRSPRRSRHRDRALFGEQVREHGNTGSRR